MTDRVPGAPGQYQMVIAQDQFTLLQKGQNAVVNIKRDDKPITEGTPYSKATVLPDELAKKLCPDVLDPTPADAFSGLLPINSVYPVGSIYMSVEDTSPAARWGGTWEKIEGRVLAGAGSPQPNTSNTFGALSGQSWRIAAKEKGGQDYNTLTVETIPPHSHPIQLKGSELIEQSTLEWTYNVNARVYSGQDLVRPTGGGKPHNNMMPYYGCYMWVRLA